MAILHAHPFPVEAFFRRSLVLAYALPEATLTPWLRPGLTLDTYDGLGFLAIALVETENLRPKGFPAFLGRNFFLSGYRIFTKFSAPGKPPRRGLRILRSDTDKRAMRTMGNLLTHYNYCLADVQVNAQNEQLRIQVSTPNAVADLDVEADLRVRPGPLPEGTPFRSLEDARTFAGPLPFTFGYDDASGKMMVVKGLRTSWAPVSVVVKVHHATFLKQFSPAPILANAFYVENVNYAWKAGELEAIA
jgi:Uncharacterized conserved protein (COG2071)